MTAPHDEPTGASARYERLVETVGAAQAQRIAATMARYGTDR